MYNVTMPERRKMTITPLRRVCISKIIEIIFNRTMSQEDAM
jgi:hypothetical protein